MKMKLYYAVAVAVLILAVCSQGQANYSNGPKKCCIEYYSKPIPPKAIKSYDINPPNCPKKGVLLVTLRNKELCADPDDKLVQQIIKRLDKKRSR